MHGLEKEETVARSVKQDEADKQTLETARRWSTSTSKAENRAVYGSGARDLGIWFSRSVAVANPSGQSRLSD